MRDMTVTGLILLVLLLPLHESAVTADLKRRQALCSSLNPCLKLGIFADDILCAAVEVKQSADNLDIHGRRHAEPCALAVDDIAVLWRHRGTGMEQSVLALAQEAEEEFDALYNVRICRAAEIVLVECEKIVLPHIEAEPCSAHRPHSAQTVAGCGHTVYIGNVMEHNAVAVVALSCRALAGLELIIKKKIKERDRALGNISRLDRPIVHLEIDI